MAVEDCAVHGGPGSVTLCLRFGAISAGDHDVASFLSFDPAVVLHRAIPLRAEPLVIVLNGGQVRFVSSACSGEFSLNCDGSR
jgi:hypothetical protein